MLTTGIRRESEPIRIKGMLTRNGDLYRSWGIGRAGEEENVWEEGNESASLSVCLYVFLQ